MSKAVIAVVDDDEGVRDSLAALFEARGHVVATFATAQAFLTRIADLDLGCVLLDVRLPDMGGLDVQQRLRDKGLNVPVVIMTGYGDVALAVSAMKAGARDFIEKPFQSEQIGKAVEEALGSQSSAGRAADTRMAGPGIDVLTPRELEVLELLRDVQRQTGLAILFITHDLGVVRRFSDRVVVMYFGRVMEQALTPVLFDTPRHPYTKALLASMPGTDPGLRASLLREGPAPDVSVPLSGCLFTSRCPMADAECLRRVPNTRSLRDGAAVACLYIADDWVPPTRMA